MTVDEDGRGWVTDGGQEMVRVGWGDGARGTVRPRKRQDEDDSE